MAVEIPVVVDIEKAFEDAARRVNTAVRPLKQKIEDQGVLELKFKSTVGIDELDKFGDEVRVVSKDTEKGIAIIERSFEQLWANGKPKLDDIRTAIASFKTSLNAKWNNGVDMGAPEVQSLQKAIILMEEYLAQRNRAVSLTEQQYYKQLQAQRAEEERNFILQQEAKTMAELNERLGALRGKLSTLDPKSKEWRETATEIKSATRELGKYEQRLQKILSTKPKSGSINRINSDMQALIDKWNAMSKTQKFDANGNLKASAQKVIEKFKQLTKESEQFGKSLQEAAGLANKNLKATNKELQTTDSKLGNLIKNSLRLIALHTATRFIQNIREVTSQFELQRVALGSIIQDTERAEGLFRQIKAAAVESPFEIKDLVTYTKQLSAYQIETEKLFDTTMKLADVSAGLGVDMGRLILAYGQVRAASVLRGQELRQFTEAGIPLVDKLAEKFTELRGEMVSTGEVFQLISERAVPFSMIAEIFDDMTSAGGMFYKMQEKQAETLLGQWNNLKDSVSIMYDEIGNTDVVHGAMEALISTARKAMQHWREWWMVIKLVGGSLASYAAIAKGTLAWTEHLKRAAETATLGYSKQEKAIRRFTTALIGETAAKKISTTATLMHKAATDGLERSTNFLTTAFWKLTLTMAKNPFGLAAIVVTSLITLLISLKNRVYDVNKAIDASEAAINQLNQVTKTTPVLIDQYEELSKKENLTAKEAAKLRDVSQQLAKVFPKTTEGINEQTGALVLNIEKLKEFNTETETALRKGTQAQIKQNAKAIRKNEREIERITKENARGWGRNKAVGLLSPILLPLSTKQMSENNEQLNKLFSDNQRLTEENQRLTDALNGVENAAENASSELTKWQDKLIEFNSRVDKEGRAIITISPDQIKNYNKLDEALEDIAKSYKEYADQEKILTNSLKGKTDAEKAELEGILARTKARKDLAKEELDYYNAFYLTQKNTGRDDHLQRLRNEISDITNAYKKFIELLKYEDRNKALSDIGILFPGLNGWEPTYDKMLERFNDMLNQYSGDADATRLIEQAIANIKFDDIKENLENRLNKLSDDIKRSETARNFYNNMLGLTGDEQLSASLTMSVYGQTGEEFKDRVQKEMFGALESVKDLMDKDFFNEMIGNITIFDFAEIRKQVEKLPEAIRPTFERLLSENEKDNADWLINFEKTYAKAASYQERVNRLNDQRIQKEKEARDRGKSPEEVARVTAYYNQKIAEVQLEAMKDTYTWTKAFEDLDGVSSRTLENLIDLIDTYIEKYGKDLEPQQLKELARQRDRAKQQKIERNAYAAIGNSIVKLASRRATLNILEARGLDTEENLLRIADNTQEALKELAEALSEVESEMTSYISSAKDLMNVFGSDEDASFFGGMLDQFQRTVSGVGKAGLGIAQLASGIITPQAIMQTVTGLADVISGIFGAGNAAKLRRINRDIQHQEDLLEDLTDSYDRLEKAMAKSFGSDYIYNYNKQLENLAAQQAAYEEQARLEREKGKKADEEKIKDYEKSARSTAEQIAGMSSQLSEYFSGTDLTSAARDFASSWIEAYKEFGSTTDAMKEKFQDLIENMVTQSLGAKIIQTILRPLFDEIDAMAATEGELSALEIAQIANMAPKYIEDINSAMTGLMNQLGAAGYNMRQRAGQFTGIARNIAGASEESINGLAAGINTQNFYISMISQNVAAILAAMTGETVAGVEGAAVTDPYRDQMLAYVGTLPQMRDDMYAIRSLLERVIKPNGTAATHYVATRM